MSYTKAVSRIFSVVALMLAILMLGYGQNIKLNGSGGTISGTVNVKGNIDNHLASGAYTFSGTVNMNSTNSGNTQYLGGDGTTAGTQVVNFTNALNTVSASVKTQQSPIVVNNLTVGTGNFNAATTGNILSITGSGSGSTFVAAAGSYVSYDGTGSSQTILPTSYAGTLAMTGSAGFNVTGGNVTAAKVYQPSGAGQLVIATNTFNLNGTSNDTLRNVSVTTGTLQNSMAANTLRLEGMSTNGGTITNAAAGKTEFVANLTNSGSITASGGTLAFLGTVNNNNTISTATDSIAFASDLTVGAAGIVQLTGAGAVAFAGNVSTTAGYTFTLGTNSRAYYTSTAAQNIAAPSTGNYAYLTLNGNSKKTALGNLAITNTLTNVGTDSLDMGTTNFTLSAGSIAQDAGARVRFGGTTHGLAIGTGVVEYYGSAGQTIAGGATAYNALELTGSGNKTIASGVGVLTNSDLTVSSGVTLILTDGTSTLHVGADGTGDLVVDGNVTNNGVITVGL